MSLNPGTVFFAKLVPKINKSVGSIAVTFLLEANYPKGRTNLGRYQVPQRRIWIHFTNPCLLKFPAYVYVLLYQLQLILINSSFLTEKLIYSFQYRHFKDVLCISNIIIEYPMILQEFTLFYYCI